MADEYKKEVIEYREREKKRREAEELYKTTTYYIDYTFDPDTDKFVINTIRYNEDGSKIQIVVDCVKNRNYLGNAGGWIPSLFSTDWIDIEKINEVEKETNVL